MNKPFSESCEQNKCPILEVIQPIFTSVSSVLEVGSGTGQHAVYFAGQMPHLTWYTSDCLPYIAGINMWLTEFDLTNVVPPIELDVSRSKWPALAVDAVFTANSLHIMHMPDVVNFVRGVGGLLEYGGSLVIYGPFNYKEQYTSNSNERFDQWLKQRDPLSGIKAFEKIVSLAAENDMSLLMDFEMPANNRILHFKKAEPQA